MRFRSIILRNFFILSIAFMGQAAFSENIFNINSQYIESVYYANADLGTEAESDFASIAYGNNFSFAGDWNVYSGIRLGDECTEYTSSLDFWPERFVFERSNFRFGGKFIYHYLDYGRWCYENDFVLEPFVKYTGEGDWYLKASTGFSLKAQKIKVMDKWLLYKYFNFYIEFNKQITEKLEAYFIASTHDDFRYYIFPSPLYTLGGAYSLNDKIRMHVDFQIHCCDMFTSKFFLNGEQISGGVRFYL